MTIEAHFIGLNVWHLLSINTIPHKNKALILWKLITVKDLACRINVSFFLDFFEHRKIDQLFSQAYLWASCLYDCVEIQKKLDKGRNHHHLSLFFIQGKWWTTFFEHNNYFSVMCINRNLIKLNYSSNDINKGRTFSILRKNVDKYVDIVMCAINYSEINDHIPSNLLCFFLNFSVLG